MRGALPSARLPPLAEARAAALALPAVLFLPESGVSAPAERGGAAAALALPAPPSDQAALLPGPAKGKCQTAAALTSSAGARGRRASAAAAWAVASAARAACRLSVTRCSCARRHACCSS